jgi:hypothetical protein
MRENTELGWSPLYNRVKHAGAVFAFFALPFMAIMVAGLLIVIRILMYSFMSICSLYSNTIEYII